MPGSDDVRAAPAGVKLTYDDPGELSREASEVLATS